MLRDSQLEKPVCYCHRCAGEIYDGELTEVDGFYYCPECAEETSSIEAAMAMDCAVMRTATEKLRTAMKGEEEQRKEK